jgi:hypothetical protein
MLAVKLTTNLQILKVFLVRKLICCRQWLCWLLLQGGLHWALHHLLLHWHLSSIMNKQHN